MTAVATRPARYGLSLSNRGVLLGLTTVPELLALAEEAEASGFFESVWVGDSLLAKPRLEAIVLLSALAARTRRVRLGTACLASFPLRHPLVLAAQWASLDRLAEGRTVLCVCLGGNPQRGGAFADEYRAMQVDPRTRVGRLEEGIAVLRAVWEHERASFHGRYYAFENVAFEPKPAQPRVPIWIASNPDPAALAPAALDRALARVARLADGWMSTAVGAGLFGAQWRRIQELARAAGRAPAALESAYHLMVHLHPDPETAVAAAKRYLDHYYRTDYSRAVLDAWVAYGPPELVAAKILAFVRAGCQTPILRFAAADQRGQLRQFLAEVAPRLAGAHAPLG